MVVISWTDENAFLVAHLDFVSCGRSETYLNSSVDATRDPGWMAFSGLGAVPLYG